MPDYTYAGVGATTVVVLIVYLVTHPDPVPTPVTPPRSHRRSSTPSHCSSSFGTFNGVALGVTAFSNCNDDYISDIDHSEPIEAIFPTGVPSGCDMSGCPVNVTTGLRWQCVEYGRRFLAHHRQAVFGSVWGAFNIWDLLNVTHYRLAVTMSRQDVSKIDTCSCESVIRTWQTIPNAQRADVWTAVGDLVIYDRGNVGEYGHICAVVGVEPIKPVNSSSPVALVRVAEENWNNAPWPVTTGPNAHARTLELVPNKAGNLVLQDQAKDGMYPILGVKRF